MGERRPFHLIVCFLYFLNNKNWSTGLLKISLLFFIILHARWAIIYLPKLSHLIRQIGSFFIIRASCCVWVLFKQSHESIHTQCTTKKGVSPCVCCTHIPSSERESHVAIYQNYPRHVWKWTTQNGPVTKNGQKDGRTTRIKGLSLHWVA